MLLVRFGPGCFVQIPSYRFIQDRLDEGESGLIFCGARRPHHNPRLFKYYWWVFTVDSPAQGADFLVSDFRLSFSEYLNEAGRILSEGGLAMVYNKKTYRIGDNSIWDKDRLLAADPTIEFSLDYDLDPDPKTPAGHK